MTRLAPCTSWYGVREIDGEEAHIVDAVAFMRGNRAYFEDFMTRKHLPFERHRRQHAFVRRNVRNPLER